MLSRVHGSVRWLLLMLPLLLLLLPSAEAVPELPYDLAPSPPGPILFDFVLR